MHFRIRNNIIQIVRTTYDSVLKKPRTEIVGRLDRAAPEVGPELLASCTPAEVDEVRRWIGSHMRAHAVAAEHAARTLGEQMSKAAEWFSVTTDGESARLVASQAQQNWVVLRNQLRRRGWIE
jgi:hypothetical protein